MTLRILTLGALLGVLPGTAGAQATGPVSFELAAGLQSYYAPLPHFSFKNPQPVVAAGANLAINPKQTLELGLRIGYHRGKYQGDALYAHTLLRYAPVIGKHFQPMVGIGFGYQLSFYPSESLKHNGSEWVAGTKTKGVWQVPLQIGIGYHHLEAGRAFITPYFAYQANALLGYSPDLSPLPASQFLLGIKYVSKK